jgi:hypothetical protein
MGLTGLYKKFGAFAKLTPTTFFAARHATTLPKTVQI